MRIDRLISKAISDCHFLGGVRVPYMEIDAKRKAIGR